MVCSRMAAERGHRFIERVVQIRLGFTDLVVHCVTNTTSPRWSSTATQKHKTIQSSINLAPNPSKSWAWRQTADFRVSKSNRLSRPASAKENAAWKAMCKMHSLLEAMASQIISAGYRHAQAGTERPSGPKPLAMRLADDHSVQSVLLSGQKNDGRSTCRGLFDSLETEQAHLPPFSRIPHSPPHVSAQTQAMTPSHCLPHSHLWHRPLPWHSGATLPLESLVHHG